MSIKSLTATGLARVGALRDLLVKQRTQLMNCTRSLLAELGIIAAQGRRGFAELVARVNDGDAAIPPVLLTALLPLIRQIEGLHTTIAALEDRIIATARENPVMRRLAGIPGIGGLTAHAIVTAVGDGRQFGSARETSPPGAAFSRRQERASAAKRHDKGISGDVGCTNCWHSAPAPSCAMPDHNTTLGDRVAARHPGTSAGQGRGAGAGRQKNARIAWALLVSRRNLSRPATPTAA